MPYPGFLLQIDFIILFLLLFFLIIFFFFLWQTSSQVTNGSYIISSAYCLLLHKKFLQHGWQHNWNCQSLAIPISPFLQKKSLMQSTQWFLRPEEWPKNTLGLIESETLKLGLCANNNRNLTTPFRICLNTWFNGGALIKTVYNFWQYQQVMEDALQNLALLPHHLT